MLPVPAVAGRAVAMAREHGCDTVWFGAAARSPCSPRRCAGGPVCRRCWRARTGTRSAGPRVPGGRHAVRRIAGRLDALTAVSGYVRARLAATIAPLPAPVQLPPGVDTDVFRPDPGARDELRRRHRLGDRPIVTCVARLVRRKGQDMLIKALRGISAPGAGRGPAAGRRRPGRRATAPAGRRPRRCRTGRVRRPAAVGAGAGLSRGRRRICDAQPHPRRRGGSGGPRPGGPGGGGVRPAGGGRGVRWCAGDGPAGRDRARCRRPPPGGPRVGRRRAARRPGPGRSDGGGRPGLDACGLAVDRAGPAAPRTARRGRSPDPGPGVSAGADQE